MEPSIVLNPEQMKNEKPEDIAASGNDGQVNKEKLGSGPSGPIPDGGGGPEKQPKENTGKDSNMGGAGGGTSGMGISKEKSSMDNDD